MKRPLERYRIMTIVAASALAMGLAAMGHEASHVLTGWMAGGSPTLLTATEVKGEFGSLSPFGFALFGASGSIFNVLCCALGWWLLRRRSTVAEFQLFAWFMFAVNGMLVGTKMMVEPIVGFGDWMTVLRPFGDAMYLRVLVAVLGTGGTVFLAIRSAAALARLIPPGDASDRTAEARRIVLIGAVAAGVLLLGASIASPVGTNRSMLLALGASLGPFVPMFSGARRVKQTPSSDIGRVNGGWPWFLAAGAIIVFMWFVVGPGITLQASI